MTRITALEDRSGGPVGVTRVALLVVAILLLVIAVGVLLAGPMLFRMRLIDLPTAMGSVQQLALYAFIAALGCGVIGLLMSFIGGKHRAGIVAVLVTAAAGMGAGSLFGRSVSRDELPPIHDAQTDWSRPVAFTEATLKSRAAAGAVRVRDDALVAEGEGKWGGKPFSEAQTGFYANIKPLLLDAPVARVAEAAIRAAERIGCTVTTRDLENGVIEAVFRSPWYELEHDVAIRVAAEGAGSRIDVRATSRLPGHDMGANAALVKQFIDEIVMAL
jgi:hypothetical protein